MEDLATLWPVLGGGGVFGILVVVIVAQMRSQAAQAASAAGAIKDAEERADKAEERERIARQKADDREEKLQSQLDAALAARRLAEDRHAQVILEVRRLQFQVDRLELELGRVVHTTGGGEQT